MSSRHPSLICSDTSELHVFHDSANFPKKRNSIESSITPTTSPESSFDDCPNMSLQHTPSGCIEPDTSPFPTPFEGEGRRLTLESIATYSFTTLLCKLQTVRENHIFTENGYKQLDKISNTLQGELYKAQTISNGQYVAIKRTKKSLFKDAIAIQDDINFCVSENIIKEGLILKYLTVDNTPIGDHIIKYIDAFEDDTHHYLVMEYIESQINLKQFVARAHQYMAEDKLEWKQYQKIIKYLFWQLVVTIRWMHHDMKCCHLDVCMENIMLKNCSFIEGKDGLITINPSIGIKLGDFGVAETFAADTFLCNKSALSIDNESYLSPNVFSEELYDARSADIWSLGMILFECLCGKPLYSPVDIWTADSDDIMSNGYNALHNGCLKQYIFMNTVLRCFNTNSLALLLGLLNVKDDERLQAVNVVRHKWFKMYFKKYCKQIERKTLSQKRKLLKQKETHSTLPFYILA